MADPEAKPSEPDVGEIAHDMRNALATIMMNVTLLKKASASGDASRIEKHVEIIGRASEKLQALVVKLRPEPTE